MRIDPTLGVDIIGIKVDKVDDIKISNEADTIRVELPLCYRDPVTREIKCTGKYIAVYKKGYIGPVELRIIRE